MVLLVASDLDILGAMAASATHHFAWSPPERRQLARLWVLGLIRLRPGDVWEITPVGRELLSPAQTLH